MSRLKHKIVVASWVSISGNALLAVLKLIVGFISGSYAVIADGIDSIADIFSSIVTLIAARIINRPPNIRFPYGYIKADTVATKVLSVFIFIAGLQLAIATVRHLIDHTVSTVPSSLAIYVTLFSIVVKLALSLYLRATGKQINSAMLKTLGAHMRNDMLISGTVLVGLLITIYFEIGLVDRIIALVVSLFIMFDAGRIFMRSNTELMDGITDPELYNQLFTMVNQVEGASNPHRTRARKIGSYYMINMDIEVDADICVKDAHDIAKNVENHIKANIENVYDVMIHVEPKGNRESDEQFGISEKDVR